MKRKLNLASMEVENLNANEMASLKGGMVVFKHSAYMSEGLCFCSATGCSTHSDAAAKANDDRISDHSS